MHVSWRICARTAEQMSASSPDVTVAHLHTLFGGHVLMWPAHPW